MRIIFEDRKQGHASKRIERADKRDIQRRRRAKVSRLRFSGAIIGA